MKIVDNVQVGLNPNPNAWLTRRELAARLKVSSHTVARWEKQGLLRGIRINRRVVRYSEAEATRLTGEATAH